MTKFGKSLLVIGASLLITGGIMLATYEATTPDKEDVVVKSLNEYIVEDYHSVIDTLSEGTSVFFYEVETILNGEIDSLDIDSVRVVDYRMIIQTEKNTHFIHRNLEVDTRDVETVYDDTWGGCYALEGPEFPISFETALALVKDSEYKTTHTKYMTLRRPLGMRYPNAVYIFGNSHNGGLAVDSVTGEVYIHE